MADGQAKKFGRGLYGINPAWVTWLKGLCEVMERNCCAVETDEEVRI
jgi:hypothetical protein